MDFDLQLPTIDDEKLETILRTVTPVVQRNGQWYAVTAHPRKTSLLWLEDGDIDWERPLDLVVREVPSITFHCAGSPIQVPVHGWLYHGWFRPTAAEIIAQTPERHLQYIDAFSIERIATDMRQYMSDPLRMALYHHNIHVGLTTTYNLKSRLDVYGCDLPPHQF